MSLKQRIEEDIKRALVARDKPRLGCLRMLKSKLQEREVALRGERGRDAAIDDEEVVAVISAYAKQRRDSIESYEAGGREDLAARERAELEIVGEYLPRPLDPAEVRALAAEAIAETGAQSARDIGAVMKRLVPRTRGRADGKQVNAIVRELLAD